MAISLAFGEVFMSILGLAQKLQVKRKEDNSLKMKLKRLILSLLVIGPFASIKRFIRKKPILYFHASEQGLAKAG
jgi:hypothetical protein